MFSKGYIPADTLTACGLTVAMYDFLGENHEAVLDELTKSYSQSYKDEDIQEKIISSYEITKSSLPTLFNNGEFNDENYAAACKTLFNVVSEYKINGSKKRSLLNGALFKKEKKPIEDVKKEVGKLLLIYHVHLQTGKIKL